jgi:type III pantothenate kinase
MLLAIDVGNTNTVFAVFQDDRLVCQWRSATRAGRTADEYAVWLIQLMSLRSITPRDVGRTIISTVVPQALFELRKLCRSYFSNDPLVVGEGVDLGIKVLMERPGEVGADRLVNAVAAGIHYGAPLMAIDFGTATTFDIIDGDRNYRGGVIAPGVNLSLQALHMAAAKLPHIAVERPTHVIGGSTLEAMQSGIYWGYIALVEGLVERIRRDYLERFGGPLERVIATGGLAPLFAGGTAMIEVVDPDHTIRGLYEIDRRNRPDS